MITLVDVRQSKIDLELCESVEQKILDILNGDAKLNLKELVFVLGQTLIDVGGTIEGINEKPLVKVDGNRRIVLYKLNSKDVIAKINNLK